MNLQPRRVRRFDALFSALVVTLFSASAEAFILPPPCYYMQDTTFAPTHPHAKNRLTFKIVSSEPFVFPVGDLVLTKATYGNDFTSVHDIRFDVVAVPPDAAAMFPDYQVDSVSVAEDTTIVTGIFGPLFGGQYTVTTSYRVYDSEQGLQQTCDDKTATLLVYGDGDLSPVIEYYNSNLDQYFMTQSLDEIAALDDGVVSGWVRTGQSFFAYIPGHGEASVHRWYGLPSAGLDTHFFFTGAEIPQGGAADFLGFPGVSWIIENDEAFDLELPDSLTGACPTGDIPVYRLWNHRADSGHRYATDPTVKAQMIAKGYVAEGVGPDAVTICAPTM